MRGRSSLHSPPRRRSTTRRVERVLERGAGNPRKLTMARFVAGALRTESEQRREERSKETERRQSTVLFADLTGFTAMCEALEPEQMFPIVSDCMELLNGIAVKHGGTVDKYLGDCVIALFGIPRAIEDAPRAAVNAAIEMIAAVDRFNEERKLDYRLDVHIGINTGLGIAGEISGPLIREFAVMGDSVVIASSLTDVAVKGEVYVGADTWRFTRDEFEYRQAEPVALKGRSEKVAAYELVSRTQRLHRQGLEQRRKIFSAAGRSRRRDEDADCGTRGAARRARRCGQPDRRGGYGQIAAGE